MGRKTAINIIITILVLIIVIFVAVVGIDKMEETMYQQCCYDNGGEILVSGFDCSIPSSCAYCSIKLNITEDCKYTLLNELR